MRALSLEYHDVVAAGDFDASGFPGAGPASYKLALPEFERHLDAIAASVQQPPSRANDWLQRGGNQRPLFLTFDDGGVGAYSWIADALERRGWRGHFFMTGERIGTRTFLNRSQLRELRDRGHIIGTHSYSHPARMGGCTPDRIRDEWERSIEVIADVLGERVLTGSVPGGFYTKVVGEKAAAAGLKLLFTSAPTTKCWDVDGCRVVGRYTLRRWSTPATAAALARGSLAPRSTQWAIYSALNLVRSLAGDHYTRIRQQFWMRRA